MYFFLEGLCFGTWASRIPDIQRQLHLSESSLGVIILAIPIGLLISLPLTGWLVFKIGSRKVMSLGLLFYAVILISIGYVETKAHLMLCLFLFGFSSNMSNIGSNTQAVAIEGLYERPIMASFHGVWSLAGLSAALIGAFMIGLDIIPFYHFIVVALVMVGFIVSSYRNTLKTDNKKRTSGKVLVWPEKSLIRLGIIAFFSMMCEGAMFDWSGVYFNNVIGTEKVFRSSGYIAFMSTMAIGRFISDPLKHKFGSAKVLQASGCLIGFGLIISITFPYLFPAICGFLLVGLGVSSIIPLVYSAAGNSKILEVGVAITAVSTFGFLGFLIGPPLIGLVAGVSNLRVSFGIIAVVGFSIFLFSKLKQNN
jgi:MFS family permease